MPNVTPEPLELRDDESARDASATALPSEHADPVPSSGGLDEDVPCPQCGYNLRGLTHPQCPECGYQFEWLDVPDMRTKPTEYSTRNIILLMITFVGAFVLMIAGGEVLAILLALAATALVMIPLAALQSVFECLAAWPSVGVLTWRRFKTWVKGVLIGYGACSMTFWVLGQILAGTTQNPWEWRAAAASWAVLALTAVESFVIQVWVLNRSARYGLEPIPPRRLLAGCLLAKAPITAFWLWLLRELFVLH
ncbi:MAG: hypothetical protein JXQ73_28970 [Phycisphaerae bacterium]|nr:hypothetical protein [Phycisphaerae bacterium]